MDQTISYSKQDFHSGKLIKVLCSENGGTLACMLSELEKGDRKYKISRLYIKLFRTYMYWDQYCLTIFATA